MNKQGIAFLFTLMMAVTIIVLALAFANPLQDFVEDARQPDTNTTLGLDCANTSISDFDQATCIATDINMPLFIGAMVAIALAIMGGRILLTK